MKLALLAHTVHDFSQVLPTHPLLHSALEQALLLASQNNAMLGHPLVTGKTAHNQGHSWSWSQSLQASGPASFTQSLLGQGGHQANCDPAKLCGEVMAHISDHRAVFSDCLLCAIHIRGPKIGGMVVRQERGSLEPHSWIEMGRNE